MAIVFYLRLSLPRILAVEVIESVPVGSVSVSQYSLTAGIGIDRDDILDKGH